MFNVSYKMFLNSKHFQNGILKICYHLGIVIDETHKWGYGYGMS
jgi:hypothetical protein